MKKIIIGLVTLSSISTFAADCKISATDFLTQSTQLLARSLEDKSGIYKTTSIHSIDFSAYSTTAKGSKLEIKFLVRTAYLNPEYGRGQKIKEGDFKFKYGANCELVPVEFSLEF